MVAQRERDVILVVDDVPENIDILDAILQPMYTVKAALRGEKALELANTAPPPDLILLDIMMPGMDGYEVCRRLKCSEATRDIPVVFVTAMADIDDETKGFGMGAADYIIKPVIPSMLLARVKTQLQLRKALAELRLRNEVLLANNRLREHVEQIFRHDLKTPLSFALNVPEMLIREGNLSKEQVELLTLLKQAGKRMLHIVNHYMDLLQIENGTYQPNPVRVDLVPMFKEICRELCGAGANLPRIELDGRVIETEDTFPVLGEELLCYGLFANLVRNAIEAGTDSAAVKILLESGDPGRIVIRNPGEVVPAIRERFFEKYVSAGKSRGTGLGTYTGKLMAEAMGGGVSLDTSTPGQTTLTVVLPSFPTGQ
ncbi:MAG: hybrid sensor histidine kinase/response regulator [Proteobacteria bacterium]|nr:hybrid sensor histidine kinase/response regulator [Pseudomonadota bacterium]MBU1685846.1 hybrid sensor histidine kinase/response regulator [Pseudomonadota bacterium]